eukprot:g4567.t1
MDPSSEVDVDLTSNITEAELDRPGYLPTSADCIKWAEDGRLAVNVGSMVMVYQPRFEGREWYGSTTFTVPCPGVDSTLLDLQRFPGKAGDFVEFSRKGLKYLTADESEHLIKCAVGGDSNTISAISWSSRGCAWDGGCLLSVVTSLHAVTVYQPARESLCDMEWEPLASVSTALVEWGLRVCPSDGAWTYRSRLKLDGAGAISEVDLQSGDAQRKNDSGGGGGGGDGGGGNRGDGFALAGLWAVARAARTRSAAWMGRRVPGAVAGAPAKGRGGDGGVSAPVGGGGEDFTLLALGGESTVTLWAFSGLAGSAAAGAAEENGGAEEEEGRSLGLVRERPAWAGDLRALGAGVADGEIKALGWCQEDGDTAPPPGDTTWPRGSSDPIRDFLAVGTSTGAVFLLRVDIGCGSGGGGHVNERGGTAEALAMAAAAHDHNVTGVSAIPFPAPVSSAAAPSTLAASGPSSAAAAETTGSTRGSGKEGAGRGEGARKSPAAGGGKKRRRQEGGAGHGGGGGGAGTATTSDGWSTALIYTSSMDGSCKEWEVGVGARGGGDEVRGKGAAKARLRKLVSGDSRRAENPAPLLGCSASPNGVLVACLEFCRLERSTRKAVQQVARKGTHCRVVLTPMVPPATERAATAAGGRESSWNFPLTRGALSTDWAWYLRAAILGDAAVHSSRGDVGSFSLIPTLQRALEDALLTTAAAATTTTTDEDGGSVAARSRPSSKPTPALAAAAAATAANGEAVAGGGSCRAVAGGGRRPSARLWDLLRLHHLVVATAASVARCQASVHVPPVADNGDSAGETDEDDDEDDDDGDDDDGQGAGGDGGASDGNGDSAPVADAENGDGGGASSGKGKGKPKDDRGDGEEEETAAAAAAADSRPGSVVAPPAAAAQAVPPASQLLVPPTSAPPTQKRPSVITSSRPKRTRNETPLERRAVAAMAKVKKIRRLQDAADRISVAERAARASAAESAIRSRLVLLRAWERLQAGMAAADAARERAGRAGAGTVQNGGGAPAPAAPPPVLQQHHPPVPGAHWSATVAQGAASERCLRDACWLARLQPDPAPARPGQGTEQPGRSAGGAGAAGANGVSGAGAPSAGVGGFLAGPSATPAMDLPRKADVRAALSLLSEERDSQANGGGRWRGGDMDGGGPPGAPGAAVGVKRASAASLPYEDEVCLLCGSPVLRVGECTSARVAKEVTAGVGGSGPEPGGGSGGSDARAPPGGDAEKNGNVGVGAGAESGGEGEKAGAADATGVLELPGWAVCRRGHRLRRCMDTLAPALGVGYRRCDVCRCVLVLPESFPVPEVGEGGGEVGVSRKDRGKASWMRERSSCAFCNVSLSSGSSAVSWLG